MQMAQSTHRFDAEHQLKVERQLFDVHGDLAVCRTELEFVLAQLGAAEQRADQAIDRAAQAETELATREHCAARRHLRDLRRRRDEISSTLERLVMIQDGLFAKLIR